MPNRPTDESETLRKRREAMAKQQIERRGIQDEAVIDAMATVRRHVFVPERMRNHAYDDTALPLRSNQTISQPYIVALTTAALELETDDRVLEIGTGSGYAAAVMGAIVERVDTIERLPELVEQARETLRSEGFDNVHVHEGDGTLGLPDRAPFDAIAVTAAAPDVPDALIEQLAPGGRIVIPVHKGPMGQRLKRVVKRPDGEVVEHDLGGVRFVPLVGEQGFDPDTSASDLMGFV